MFYKVKLISFLMSEEHLLHVGHYFWKIYNNTFTVSISIYAYIFISSISSYVCMSFCLY